MSLAENLKRLRADARLTQEDLAAATGIKQTAISRYEKGKSVPDVSSLLRLATGLRVPLEALLEGEDVKFDAVYQGLRVSINTAGDKDESLGADSADPIEPELRDDEIVPDAPPSQASDEPPTAADLAKTYAALNRTLSELVSIAARLPTGPPAVARVVGPQVRPVHPRDGARTRRRNAPRPTQKRR